VRARARGTREALVLAAVLAAGLLASCASTSSSSTPRPSQATSSSPATSTPTDTSSSPSLLPPQTLTFGVIGSEGEIEQYRTMADSYAPFVRKVTVKVQAWPNDAAMLEAFRDGTPVPDVFLASRRHLDYLVARHLIQPVDQLLDDRGLDFGDEYPRSSLTAFAADNRLQCLPYDIQPSVIYYNTKLVDFDKIKNDPPAAGEGWTIDQFARAGRWAVRHHPGVAGMYLDPSLPGIAPFVYSGGGDLYDDDTRPTSLDLSDETNLDSLTQTVRALHSPGAMLSEKQLTKRSALAWFERGKLALIEGDSHMVPELRESGVHFDVMPMPSLGSAATVGALDGMCLSSQPRDVGTAADFLVYANSPGALDLVSFAGYLQPANQTVALSDAFQQPGQQPHHASVFTFSVKSMRYPPVVGESDELDLALEPWLERLVRAAPEEVPRLTRKIDRASYRVLGPTFGPSASPSQSDD
jgi:multiple sugar transport system substrate-binding protein